MSERRPELNARSIGLSALRRALTCLRPLLLFGFAFYVLSSLILTPLRGALLRGIIEATGRTALANFDIAAFLLSPLGLTWLVVFASTGLLLLLGQQTGFLFIARTTRAGRLLNTLQIGHMTIACLPRLLGMALVQTLIVVACCSLFGMAAALLYWLLLSGNDINYFLAEWPPRFLIACGLAFLLALALAAALSLLFICWSLALPICVFERKSWTAPLRQSWEACRGSVLPIGLSLIGWLAGIALLLSVATAAFVAGAEWIISAIPQRAGVVIVATGCLVVAIDLVLSAIALVGIAGYGFLVEDIYVGLRGESETVAPTLPNPPRDQGARWKRVTIGLALFLALSLVSSYALIETIDADHRVEITAHRGSSRKAPENTLSAIRQAIEDGADYAEIDVQQTADGVVVLLHDTDLKRVTGANKQIWRTTYEDLKRLDAGSWFSAAFAGEPIPTLQQAIEEARGRIKLNIELKLNGHDDGLVERVVKLIDANRFVGDCVVSSLDYAALKTAKTLEPRLRTGLIVSANIGDIIGFGVEFLSLLQARATAATVANAGRRNLGVHVWTVNEQTDMHRMIDLRVENIITDRPETLRAVLAERADLNDLERLLLAVSHRLRSRR